MKFDSSKGLLGSFLKFLHLPGLYYYWWPPDFRIFTVELWFFFSFHSEFRKYQEFLTNLYFEKSKGVEEVIIWKKQVGNGGSVLLNWTGFDCSHVKTDPSYSISDLQKRFWSFSKDFLGPRNVKVLFSPQCNPYLGLYWVYLPRFDTRKHKSLHNFSFEWRHWGFSHGE